MSAVVSHDGRWWALVGAGASPKPTDYRRVAWKAFAVGGEVKASEVALMGVGSAERARFAAEGFALSGYRFDAYVAPPKKQKVEQWGWVSATRERASASVSPSSKSGS